MGLATIAAISMAKESQPANAATVTIYAKMEHSWWTADGAAIGIYCWASSGDPKVAWPGERMTSVDSSQGLWSFDIDIAAYPNVIFTRVNGGTGSVSDWGAKTKDLTFPTDGKNLFTITNSSATWGTGCDGEWSTYGGGAVVTTYNVTTKVKQTNGTIVTDTVQVAEGGLPVAPTINYGQIFSSWFSDSDCTSGNEVTEITSDTTVYGKISYAATKSYVLDASEVSPVFDTPYIYSWDSNGKNGAWPGQELGGTDIYVPATAKIIITDGAATNTKQTVDITQSGVNGDKLIIHNTLEGGKYTAEWESDILGENNFVLKFRSQTINFALADEGKPEGVLHQFKATLPNGIRGGLLEFYKGDNKITENIGVDYSEGQPVANNNIVGDVTNGFRIYHSKDNMEIYLKTYSDGGMSLWGTGYDENVFYLSYYNIALHLDEEFTPYGDYIKQFRCTNPLSMVVRAENETKYAIYDEPGWTQHFSMETAGDNNAYQDSDDTHFNLYNDCTEVVYLKMKADLTLWLYIGGRTHNRTLIIGGEEHQLEVYQPEGETLQYRVTNVNLTAGQSISYRFDGEAQTITAKAIGNNNLTSDLKVFADATGADLYLDPENMTLWVGGLGLENATGFHLLITNDGNETVQFLKMTLNENNTSEYYSAAHAFTNGDMIQIVDCSHADALPVVFNPAGGLNDYSTDEFYLDEGVAYCGQPVTATAYIQLDNGNDKLYFGSVPSYVAEAIEFTNNFRSSMAGACGQTEYKQDYVETAWNSTATSYSYLSDAAKAALAEGLTSDYNDIVEFAERYIAIKRQHSSWSLNNFMGWDIPSSNTMNPFTTNNSVVLVVVMIAAFTCLTSLGLFFVIRKRKHQ